MNDHPLQGLKAIYEEITGLLNKPPQTFFPLGNRHKNVPAGDEAEVEGMPPIRPAPPWRTPPTVIGSPEFVKATGQFMDLAPELKGRIKSVQQYPTSGVFKSLLDSDMDFRDYDSSTLLGQFDTDTKRIFVNPMLGESVYRNHPMEKTILHELGHVSGIHHGNPDMKRLEDLGRGVAGLKKVKP